LAFRAALLRGGATGLLLFAAFPGLFTAAQFGVRFAAGAFGRAAGKFGLAAILGFLLSGRHARKQQAQRQKRTGKQFRKHGSFSNEVDGVLKNHVSPRTVRAASPYELRQQETRGVAIVI
jgi:hypothetical protein